MARARKSREEDADSPVGWGEIIAFGTLFVGVVGVLALGAILKTDSPHARPATLSPGNVESFAAGSDRQPRMDPPAVTRREEREPARQESHGDTSSVGTPEISRDLVRRAEADLQRLMADGQPWTLQLALLCDPGGVSEAVDRFGSHGAFHLLPNLHDDRACFVLSWNRYGTSEAAKAARDLPESIRSSYPGAFPKAVAEVLR